MLIGCSYFVGVSNFIQTTADNGDSLHSLGVVRRLFMSTVDVLRQCAEEALRQAVQSKNEKEQLALIELVRTWTQAPDCRPECGRNSVTLACLFAGA
jgi:hypothetical protein